MTTENHYNPVIEKLLERIAFLQGSLYHIKSDLLGFQKCYHEARKEKRPIDFRLGSSLVIRDLSGPTDKGWNYVYPTKQKYTVKLSNYKEFNERVIVEYASYTIIQSYEAFQHFVKVSLSKYYFSNPHHFLIHNVFIEPKKKSFKRLFIWLYKKRKTTYRESELMRMISPGKYSSKYFARMKKISAHYRKFENKNNGDIKLIDFHKVFAICRHAITHEESIITKSSIKKLTNEQHKLLEVFVEESSTDSYKVRLTNEKASFILQLISEHAFLIYKSLSIKENLNWKGLLSMR